MIDDHRQLLLLHQRQKKNHFFHVRAYVYLRIFVGRHREREGCICSIIAVQQIITEEEKERKRELKKTKKTLTR